MSLQTAFISRQFVHRWVRHVWIIKPGCLLPLWPHSLVVLLAISITHLHLFNLFIEVLYLHLFYLFIEGTQDHLRAEHNTKHAHVINICDNCLCFVTDARSSRDSAFSYIGPVTWCVLFYPSLSAMLTLPSFKSQLNTYLAFSTSK